MGIVGIISIILVSFLLCNNKRKINIRTVGLSFLLLIVFTVFIFAVPLGVKIIRAISDVASIVLQQGQEGAKFLFGDLATKQGFVFAILVLTNVIFLGAFFAVLYYLRIMQPINHALAFLLCKFLKISKAEGLTTVVTMFLGPGESQLAVKPFLSHLTKSEMFTIMVSSFAAIAGSVMGGYIALGMPAQYIVSAVLMTVPASIFISKLMYPQTEDIYSIENKVKEAKLPEEKASSIIEAIAIGSFSGLKVAAAIGIMLVSFVSLIALINIILGYFGGFIHMPDLTLQKILGVVLAPVAYVLGVPTQDITTAGFLIGEKTITNEFVAYLELKQYMPSLDPKTQAIVIFSLCGFANLGTVGIFMGAIQGIVPEKVKEFGKMAVKALFAAILVNLLNGALAGIMFDIQHWLQ